MTLVVLAAGGDLELAERGGEADGDARPGTPSASSETFPSAPAPDTTTSATSRAPGWLAW